MFLDESHVFSVMGLLTELLTYNYVSPSDSLCMHNTASDYKPTQCMRVGMCVTLMLVSVALPLSLSVPAYFPTSKGLYVPVVFVPGLYGAIYAEWYSDVLSKVASHGFIVIGVDPFWPASHVHTNRNHTTTTASVFKQEPEFMYRVVQWASHT